MTSAGVVLAETVCVKTPISAPWATPVTHATPVTSAQTRRSTPYPSTFPGPCQASPSGHGSRLSGDRAGSRTDASARPAPTHHLTVLPRLLAWRANHGTERHSFTVGRPSTHR